MNHGTKPLDLEALRAALEKRRSTLLEAFRRDLADQEREGYAELASEVRDLGDDAAADVLLDSRLLNVQRDAAELREVREALARMDNGGYGVCLDCGREIAAERLRVEPASARCLDCQSRHERDYGRANPRAI